MLTALSKNDYSSTVCHADPKISMESNMHRVPVRSTPVYVDI